MSNDDGNIKSFAIELTESDPFSDVLPRSISKLSTNINKISVSKHNQTHATLLNESTYARYIYFAIYKGTLSDWFAGLKFARHYLRHIKDFVLFLNNYVFDSVNRYQVLKAFESYRVNECGLKPQSTGLLSLISIIKRGIENAQFPSEQILYLVTLTNVTKPSKSSGRIPHTLSHWFNISWLKAYIGEETFLILESPRMLIESFNVTIATTLSYLIDAKKEVRKKLKDNNITIDDLCSGETDYTKLVPRKKYKYSQNLFKSTAMFEEGYPLDKSTQCMLLDLVNQFRFEQVIDKIKTKGVKAVPFIFSIKKKSKMNFTNSMLFTPQYLYSPSPLEELLFCWLVASQMVQPEDILKLKKTNYNFERNSQGKVILVQCNYYKGRSGSYKETPLLNNTNVELKAFVDYFSILPSERKYVFSKEYSKTPRMNIPNSRSTAHSSKIALLIKLLESKELSALVTNALIKENVSNVFYKAFMGLNKSSSITYDSWNARAKKTREEYFEEVNEPLPINIFQAAHIKTSAVYSKTDLYREGDLVNYNSHTAHTEKLSYLSDNNKEWVNQCGRISRLVFNDIENNIYKTNVNAVDFHTNEQIVKTKVLNATGTKDGKINVIGHYQGSEVLDDDSGRIMVIDSVETAVNMLHYIKQADVFAEKLLVENPKFFERTLLVNVEWMHHILSKLKVSTVKEAQLFYSNNFKNFPDIFTDELRGGVTS
jgi:hypothetical protein